MPRPSNSSEDCPCKKISPNDFLENAEIDHILNDPNVTFTQKDAHRLLNCVHCNDCGSSDKRVALNRKFREAGFEFKDSKIIRESFQKTNTPFPVITRRVKVPPEVPKTSKTLFYMGCLSTFRTPELTNHALQYLVKQGVDFTILKDPEVCCGYTAYVAGEMEEFNRIKALNIEIFNRYERVICLCPACYFVFRDYYPKMHPTFQFITDFLEPTKNKKSGSVGVQHLCQLMYRGVDGVEEKVDTILKASGYTVEDIPHECCGGGVGYVFRTDVIDQLAKHRIQAFKGDYYTTYCPGCYWILHYFQKCRPNKASKLVDLYGLLL
jgi:Fe-S oxidoreductase